MPAGAVVSRDKGFVMRTRTWAGLDRSSRPDNKYMRMILHSTHIQLGGHEVDLPTNKWPRNKQCRKKMPWRFSLNDVRLSSR